MKQRIRITADGRIIKPKRDRRESAPFMVLWRIRRNAQKRTVRKALVWTTLAHLLLVLTLFYFIKPQARPFDSVIHVEMVNEVLEKRKVIKPKTRQVKLKPATVSSVNQHLADTTVKVQTSAARFEAPEANDVELKADDSLPSDTLTTTVDLPHTGTIAPGTGTTGTQNIASAEGGKTNEDNCQMLCKTCNREKSAS